MTNEFLAFAPISTAPAGDPARALLDEMMARVGVDGLAAAFGDAGREVDAAGLASYAKSIAAAAVRMSRPLPEPGHAPLTGTAWLAAEWHLMRLVAVCLIAETADLL